MGCGQSKIDKIYPRKRKRRGCNKSSAVDAEVDEEAEETDRTSNSGDDEDEARKKAAAKVRQVSSGPLSAHPETSSSQLDFFKMLDEKIEKGADYDSTSEEEVAHERARLASLIRGWESASCSTTTVSSRSLPSTPGARRPHPTQPPLSLQKQYYRPQLQQQQLQQQQQQQQQYQLNGDAYTQQHYYHPQFAQQQQQYQHNIRGQFFMPQPVQMYQQYPRVYAQAEPKNFQSVPVPQQATSVVQYRKSRGVYTELA